MSENESETTTDVVETAPAGVEIATEAAERIQVEKGFTNLLRALGSNVVNIQHVAAHSYALAEALIAKGILNLADIDSRRAALTETFVAGALEEWHGARLNVDESDKYQVEPAVIDCESRLPYCKAACCTMQFYLSSQDLDEGIVRWEYGRPYLIRQLDDGYCYHIDRNHGACTVHQQRPLACRQYDCRKDERIWVDFEQMIPNPSLSPGDDHGKTK